MREEVGKLVKSKREELGKYEKVDSPYSQYHNIPADVIDSPAHYIEGRKYEPIEVIGDWGLNYNLGNALKYIARYKRKNLKNPAEDLHKAMSYLQRELEVK